MSKMTLEDIINISGKPGLFKIISRTKNGLIAESLEDQKRIPVFASASVSALTDISIYTREDSISLKELFNNISKKESGGQAFDPNGEAEAMADYFRSVLPDYDEQQVYHSHIRKVLKWYNMLQRLNLLDELLRDDQEQKDAEEKSRQKKAGFDQQKQQGKAVNVKASTKAKGGTQTSMPRKAS